MIENERALTEDSIKLMRLFEQIKNRAQRQKVLALAEQIVRELSQTSSGSIPPSANTN